MKSPGNRHESWGGAAALSLSAALVLHAAAGGSALVLDGDTPWVVPPELQRPSEAQSDAVEDTAQTLVSVPVLCRAPTRTRQGSTRTMHQQRPARERTARARR